ncbi:AAA family ATPase [Salmonella enterica]|nr:hypothetical protein [Salmonella enterica]EBF0758955.1 ATP-binding protein [Salmonella enterica]EJQ9848529.1 AAA family ATPase [Salmonella enterica]EJT8503786.1 AAA family ATPase [Salmonella enterica]ELM0202609.1 AAA family ATPase [Salmonella enterica]
MLKRTAINDCWRHVDNFKKYNFKIKSLTIKNIDVFQDINIDFSSAINSICGRNGVGKSTIMKIMYNLLTGKDIFNDKDPSNYFGRLRKLPLEDDSAEDFEEDETQSNLEEKAPPDESIRKIDISQCELTVHERTKSEDIIITFPNEKKAPFNVEYIDASSQVVAINNLLCTDSNPLDLIEGLSPNELIIGEIETISKITGKKYSKIELYEINWNDNIIPYISVQYGNISYSNRTMGLGEHKLLYIIWKTISSPKNSFLFIEEPESFICPRSQLELLDFIATIAAKNNLTIIFSTHSEHIIKKQQASSWHIVKNIRNKFSLVKEKRKEIVMSLLGVSPEKDMIFILEDYFASKVFKNIIAVCAPDLYNTMHIDYLNGESDITEILRRYPAKNSKVRLVAIYDADQKGQINESTFDRPILYLPAEGNVPPENEIISFIKDNVNLLHPNLNISEEQLTDIIDNIHEEIHDWLHVFSQSLSIEYDTLIDIVIRTWVNHKSAIIVPFMVALRSIEQTINSSISYINNIPYANYETLNALIINPEKVNEKIVKEKKLMPTKLRFLNGDLVAEIQA